MARRDQPMEKRKDCPVCQGTGRFLERVYTKDRKTGVRSSHTERVRCPKCKGRGYR